VATDRAQVVSLADWRQQRPEHGHYPSSAVPDEATLVDEDESLPHDDDRSDYPSAMRQYAEPAYQFLYELRRRAEAGPIWLTDDELRQLSTACWLMDGFSWVLNRLAPVLDELMDLNR
jgi:hypothetical protein